MKKIIVCILMLSMALSLNAQQLTSPNYQVRDDLLQKSKKQKTTARIMLGGGAILGTAGFFLFFFNAMPDGSDEAIATGGGMVLIGVASMVGSIPFFSASAKNKRKALELSTGVNMQRGMYNEYYPAASIKIQLK